MKLGVSLYSLNSRLRAGAMDLPGAVKWIKAAGADHMEVSASGFDLERNPLLTDLLVNTTKDVGIEVTNYLIGADFLSDDAAARQDEINRVKRHVDIAARFGAKLMRHDVVPWGYRDEDPHAFERHLPILAEACAAIADYAAERGITTTVENHGFHVQASDRMLRLVQAVNRSNFRLTLDIGNFLCVDEEPAEAVGRCLPYAATVHIKDFLVRPADRNPGEGWLHTPGGNYLRGTIFGHGDLNVHRILRSIKESGYDGTFSLEFEGPEACEDAILAGLRNARRIWDDI
jgi:sugar phosphate isomerase/epimerase